MAFPTTNPPTLTTGQFSYNGVTMGVDTPYRVTSIAGLDLPAVRSGDNARSRDQGELIGLDVLGGRDVTIGFDVQPYGSTSLATALTDLATATEVGLTTEQPLWFALPGYPTLCVMCRPRKRRIPLDKSYMIGSLVQNCSVMFHATDPRVYAAPQTVSVGVLTPGGGVSFPITWPLAFGAGGTGGSVTVTNSGNNEMRPVLTFTGPVTNPSAENSTISGAPAVTISNPTQVSYTILSGDQLVIDLDLHTVLYYSGGVASGLPGADRRSWVVYGSQWWNLPAGSNLIRFSSADSSAVAATLAVEYASAYQL